jgi:hypothetical protein
MSTKPPEYPIADGAGPPVADEPDPSPLLEQAAIKENDIRKEAQRSAFDVFIPNSSNRRLNACYNF